MLPVQTVMIRYMVLVYRWGRGWLDAVGDWGGALGGYVTGGCARRWATAAGAVATGPRARKGPADVGAGGVFCELGKLRFYLLAYSFYSTSRLFRKFCWIACARIFLIFLVP